MKDRSSEVSFEGIKETEFETKVQEKSSLDLDKNNANKLIETEFEIDLDEYD